MTYFSYENTFIRPLCMGEDAAAADAEDALGTAISDPLIYQEELFLRLK